MLSLDALRERLVGKTVTERGVSVEYGTVKALHARAKQAAESVFLPDGAQEFCPRDRGKCDQIERALRCDPTSTQTMVLVTIAHISACIQHSLRANPGLKCRPELLLLQVSSMPSVVLVLRHGEEPDRMMTLWRYPPLSTAAAIASIKRACPAQALSIPMIAMLSARTAWCDGLLRGAANARVMVLAHTTRGFGHKSATRAAVRFSCDRESDGVRDFMHMSESLPL